MTDVTSKNVYNKPLYQHSTSPRTGFSRDGYCRATNEDTGNHSIAGTITQQFLDFTKSKGNSLPETVPELKDGDRWCLCAHRWKEAYDARDSDDDPKVPKVRLEASGIRALEVVGLKDLKLFAGSQDKGDPGNKPITPSEGNSWVKHGDVQTKEGGDPAY